jgi:hypothetical protein
MDEITGSIADPREEIARLEDQIEQLAATVESCRTYALASRIALGLGGVVLLALMVGVLRFSPVAMSAGLVGVLGGIVLGGSNRSTAREAAAQLTAAEAMRAALIDRIAPRPVDEPHTLH